MANAPAKQPTNNKGWTQRANPDQQSDTRRRVRHQSPTAYSNTTNARADYPTTSGTFSNRQYQGGIPTKPTDLNKDPTTRRTIRDNQVKNPTVTYAKPAGASDSKQTQTTTNTKTTTPKSSYNTGLLPSPQPRSRTKKRGAKKIASTAHKLAARTSLLGTYAWTGFIWFIIQLPLAILTIVFIGAVFGIETLVGGGIAQDLYEAALFSFGINWDFKLAAFTCYAIFIAVCYLQLAGIWLQCSLAGMHPTSGRGGSVKTAALLTAMVLYWIPLVNLLPLSWFWVFTISLYPR